MAKISRMSLRQSSICSTKSGQMASATLTWKGQHQMRTRSGNHSQFARKQPLCSHLLLQARKKAENTRKNSRKAPEWALWALIMKMEKLVGLSQSISLKMTLRRNISRCSKELSWTINLLRQNELAKSPPFVSIDNKVLLTQNTKFQKA